MPDDSLSERLALINTLLQPIQKTIRDFYRTSLTEI
jgi:hypothetical protein